MRIKDKDQGGLWAVLRFLNLCSWDAWGLCRWQTLGGPAGRGRRLGALPAADALGLCRRQTPGVSVSALSLSALSLCCSCVLPQ